MAWYCKHGLDGSRWEPVAVEAALAPHPEVFPLAATPMPAP